MLKIFDRISSSLLPRVLPTQIICGDCAGDELLPIRTNLTSDGRCAVCGGRSFVAASRLCDALAQHLKNKKLEEIQNYGKENQNTKTNGNCIELSEELWH